MVVVKALSAADDSEELLGVAALLAQTPVPRGFGRGESDRQARRRLLA